MTVALASVLSPMAAGLVCVVFPRLAAALVALACALTAAAAVPMLTAPAQTRILLDTGGIALTADPAAAWLMLTNAAVTLAVLLDAWRKKADNFFFTLLCLLHGGVNACFLSADLFNLYVVIELTTILAFLLIAAPLGDRHIWSALRYLFISNVGMLFYLVGAILVYESRGSFALAETAAAPGMAGMLIVVGLAVKGGVFIPGLWLPLAHGGAEARVSALLSGVVVKIGVMPLLRIAALSPPLEMTVRGLGVGGALLGVFFALFERDIKRMLACSTVSQIGFILAAPVAGPFYALAHGIAKAALFLAAGTLPNRDVPALRKTGLAPMAALALALPALSLAGFPPLAGYFAKAGAFGEMTGLFRWLLMAGSLGTATVAARWILIPWRRNAPPVSLPRESCLLLAGLLLIAGFARGPFPVADLPSAFGTLAAGILLHFLGTRRLMRTTLPDRWECFEDLVGLTCITLFALLLTMGLL
jgi:multicomponent Na+:H+ antiporter subunit D